MGDRRAGSSRVLVLVLVLVLESASARMIPPFRAVERQLTTNACGHVLTNTGVWSPDSRWVVYDVRSDPMGDIFDGTRIEKVDVRTGDVKLLYAARDGACCGIATCHPLRRWVVFVVGPERPTPDWSYGPFHRQGIVVDEADGTSWNLDARDVTPSFTPGALRGGSHVHVFSPDGAWASFTYEDHVLAATTGPAHEANQRNIGMAVPAGPVRVDRGHPRNADGRWFCALVTRTTDRPAPGSDEIERAFEEGWIGANGYLRADGTRQRRALAFQGRVRAPGGKCHDEVFVCDLPDDLTVPGDGPLAGTETQRPRPPRGVTQRRLTFTADRPHPGLQGPRHWLRSSPDGRRIACLMKDDAGVAQLWTVSPTGGPPAQLTRNARDIASAFTWSPDGRWIAHAMDGSVCLTDTASGETHRLTPRNAAAPPSPLACVFSPDGRSLAYLRPIPAGNRTWNQVFVCTLSKN